MSISSEEVIMVLSENSWFLSRKFARITLREVMSDAYIASRYLPRSYSRETAEALVPCARNFLSAMGL